MTPEAIEATGAMVESARAQAAEDRAVGRKSWALEYAQDVARLLEALEAAEAELAAERARLASLAQDHTRLERELALRNG